MKCRASVAVDSRQGNILVDNTIDGMTLLELEDASFIRAFQTGTPKKRVPKQVAFGEDGKVVIGGSDHGAVYVFDRKTGVIWDVLLHNEDLVQVVTVRSTLHAYRTFQTQRIWSRPITIGIMLAQLYVLRRPSIATTRFTSGFIRQSELRSRTGDR